MTNNANGKITQGFMNKGQTVVSFKDLPLSCPMPNVLVWDAHPRVYLPIEKTGEAVCPYCSAEYILQSTTQAGGVF